MIKELIHILKINRLTISSVESCTGGHLINKITNVEGASNITNGGIVTYSNAQKVKIGVPKEIIKQYGVYSKECAEAMTTAGLSLFSSDVCIGITGTLSNIDLYNKDSRQGKVIYYIKIKTKDKTIESSSAIKVPIKERSLQKEYIVNYIIEELNNILKNSIGGNCSEKGHRQS